MVVNTINIDFTLPGPGTTINTTASLTALNGTGGVGYSTSLLLPQVVVCSFDPNDKYVTPEGVGPQGAVAPGIDLTYTIRFQNTGSAPAINMPTMLKAQEPSAMAP